jgi:hypothetical protein
MFRTTLLVQLTDRPAGTYATTGWRRFHGLTTRLKLSDCPAAAVVSLVRLVTLTCLAGLAGMTTRSICVD